MHKTDLIKEIASIIDGKGGGRDDLSEASGNNANGLPMALQIGRQKIMEYISNL